MLYVEGVKIASGDDAATVRAVFEKLWWKVKG
jgi:hypothetical protein